LRVDHLEERLVGEGVIVDPLRSWLVSLLPLFLLCVECHRKTCKIHSPGHVYTLVVDIAFIPVLCE